MKIGLSLGSFDPIHISHVNMASCLINSNVCDKVLFVVAQHNPWKKHNPCPYELRCKMVEEAIKPLGEKCEVCMFEEGEKSPVYSYIPITKALQAYPNDELYIICGTDMIETIPHWKNYETHIKGKVGLIEFKRNQTVDGNLPFQISDEGYIRIGAHLMDMSSTMIREMVKNGMNPYPYVPQNVWEIIKDNNLYK